MKLIFESWRKYIKTINEVELPDIGESFPRIDVEDIVLKPMKNTIEKITLLNIFNQLEQEPDDSKIKHILYSIRVMSGNSPDFTFDSKVKALEFYKKPYVYKVRKEDSKPTKSLKDWHEHLKVLSHNPSSNAGWVERSRKIKEFSASSDYSKSSKRADGRKYTQREINPYGETHRAPFDPRRNPWPSRLVAPISPTIRGK